MPVEFRRDLYGSTLTKAYNIASRQRAVRKFFVEDPDQETFTNTNADLEEAIDAVQNDIGSVHPNGLIQLSRIRAERFGPYQILCTAIYANPTGGGGPGDPTGLVATYSNGSAGIHVYRSSILTVGQTRVENWDRTGTLNVPLDTNDPTIRNTGLPWGDIISSTSGEPVQQPHERAVVRVTTYAQLASNPYGNPTNIGFYVNKVNSTAVIFNTPDLPGIFGPDSVRFDGAIVKQTTDPVFPFDTEYHFTIIDGKWWNQVPTNEGPFPINVDNVPMMEAVDFDNAFPTMLSRAQALG